MAASKHIVERVAGSIGVQPRFVAILLASAVLLSGMPAMAQSSGGGSSGSGGSSSGAAGGAGAGAGSGVGGTTGGGPGGAPGAPTSSGSVGGATMIGPGTDSTGSTLPNGSPAPGGTGSQLGNQGSDAALNPGIPASGAQPGATPGTAVPNANPSVPGEAGSQASTTTGIGGPAGEMGSRGGAPACDDVLAHKDFFTAKVIAGCEQQARKQGKPTQAERNPRRETTGTLANGIAPVDKPAQIQKQRETSDQRALKGICTNC